MRQFLNPPPVSILEALSNRDPERCDIWPCPGCGFEQVAVKGTRARLGDECIGCASDRLRTMPRGESLADADVPFTYRARFVAPAAWPLELKRRGEVELWNGEPWSLVISGPTESGKTMLATEMLARVMSRRRCRGLWLRASALASALEGPERETWRLRAATVPALLLDDYGREPSPQSRLKLGEVVTERFDWQRPTILTSNLTLLDEKGLSSLDPALWRRLRDGWMCEMRDRWKP